MWYKRLLRRRSPSFGRTIERWLQFIDLVEWFIPRPVTGRKTRRLYRQLLVEASWRLNFIVLTISSCMIATFGLISNSTAVIIGAMLVAPLMLPLRGLAFAALEGELQLFWRSLYSITGATLLSLVLSWMTGIIVGIPDFGSELVARTQPNLIDLGIAVSAGGISGFAKVRRGINDALAGTAIAVALMPPLCVVGLSLSQGFFNFARGAFLLYLTNLLGITLACMVVYIIVGYAEANYTLGWAIALTMVLFVPLGARFVELVQQLHLQRDITAQLTTQTVTVGEDVSNVRIRVDWTDSPPIIYVDLQAKKEITPKQALLVEAFLRKRTKRNFKVIFRVSPIQEVKSDDLDLQNLDLPIMQEQPSSNPSFP
ncbi:DUF389 domain-containing protein [[Limnothrix rosea] IAM M-220]|uniref:DUF389 domain-containing protein n=1 Tax=[Limnothrix rosea] IAM M-220 TaxID=454133 RepID=UPI00095A93F5|nr:DUF389 domain-containing protein [[Limnothrix rosea] IAM M-220]OKH17337.1 hypothetical protein NIES208_09595 [[Limnothrix rosea] IAM M-220]